MRRMTLSFLALFVTGCILAGTAAAQSSGAHYQKSSVKASIDNDGNLTVVWVEAGLGNLDVNYSLTADVVADYFCVSNSGSIPNAANKFTFNDSPEANGTFKAKNGKVSGTLKLNVPAAPSSDPPTCGRGQALGLQKVAWSNIVLTDTDNIVIFLFSGGFDHTFFDVD
jgi:hypothetical protein